MGGQERLNQRLNYAPGAADLSPRVLSAMNRSFVHCWNEEFLAYHDETVELLKRLFGTVHDCVTMMAQVRGELDAAVASVIEPGDEVLVLVNGYWGHQLVEIVRAYSAQVVVREEEWGKPYDVEAIRDTVEGLGALAREKRLLFVLDVAQSLTTLRPAGYAGRDVRYGA